MNEVDELTAVGRFRRDVGHGLDLTGSEARLAAEIAETTGFRPGPRLRRRRGSVAHVAGSLRARITQPRRRVVTVAAASGTVLAVAGALIVALPQLHAPRDHRPAPVVHPPGAAGPGPVPVSRGRARTAAELVSYSSAAAATATVPRPRQWLYQKTVSAVADARKGQVLHPPLMGTTTETWWRADGRFVADLEGRRLHYQSMRGSTISDWPSIGLSYLRSLPTTPTRLSAVIAANIARDVRRFGRAGALAGETEHEAFFENIQGLLEDVPVLPPALRAGLYGVLAKLPFVRFVSSAADMAGRSGVAFWMAEHGLRFEIIINRRTYAFMGTDTIAVTSHPETGTDGTYHYVKGGLYDALAVLQTGIVDHAGHRPVRPGS